MPLVGDWEIYCLDLVDEKHSLYTASNASSISYTIPSDASFVHENYIFTSAYYVSFTPLDTSYLATNTMFAVLPTSYAVDIFPVNDSYDVGSSVLATGSGLYGGEIYSVYGYWFVDGELLADSNGGNLMPMTYLPTDIVGVHILEFMPQYSDSSAVTISYTVVDGGGGEPDDPELSPDCNCVTSNELSVSQIEQTNVITAKIETESTIIQAAISSLENALSNSAILDYLKQSLTFRDFDFETGELSTTSQTYEGIVPLFGHFAQNVEEYLGQLVSVRGSKNEEEVKEETGGFWDLILSLFKRDEDTGKADADVEDVNEALKFRDLLNAMFPKDGATDDVITAIGSDENWTFFSDDANSSLNSQVSTFSRRSEPIVDYRSIVYGEYYEKVLGKEWSVD